MSDVQKDWFVFNGSSHEGPYSASELAAFYKSNKIVRDSLVWKSGRKSWLPLNYEKEFGHLFHEFSAKESRDLSYNEKVTKPILLKEHLTLIKNDVDRSFFKHPPKAPGSREELLIESAALLPNREEIKAMEEALRPSVVLPPIPSVAKEKKITVKSSRNKKINLKFIPIALLSFVAISLSVFLFKYLLQPNRVVENEMIKGRPELALVWNRSLPVGGQPNFILALKSPGSFNVDQLLLVTNFHGKASFELSISSIDGRILSEIPILAKSSGTIENGLSVIDTLEFLKSENLKQGDYEATLRLLTVVDGKSEVITTRSMFYLGSLSNNEFQKELATLKQEMNKKMIAPLQEMAEKYRTLISLASQISESYVDALKTIKRGSGIDYFEGRYQRQYAPLFQTLLIDNNKVKIFYKEYDYKLSQSYLIFENYGRRIGEQTVAIIEKTRQMAVIGAVEREELRSYVVDSFAKLVKSGEDELYKLESELKLLEN